MAKISFSNRPAPASPAEAFNMMFSVTAKQGEIQELPIDRLIPFEGQPFRSYSLDKLKELAEDIKDNGILSPVIVRPYVGRYQILAGHNRTNAAKLAGLAAVPCIVKDVDDNTAKLIVVNTNLNQREELLPSEKAFAYKMQMDAMKQQGKRTDLTSSPMDTTCTDNTSSPMDTKLDTAQSIALTNKDSRANIFRYIRLTYLIQPLIDMTDEKALPFRVAVNLSYLSESEQAMVHQYISAHKKTVTLDQSKMLKMLFKDSNINYSTVAEVFLPPPAEDKAVKRKAVKISYKKLGAYIPPGAPPEEAEQYILAALEFYEQHKKGQTA